MDVTRRECIMKRLIAVVMVLVLVLGTSCYAFKEWSQELTYSDPQTIGGKWTISFDNGDTYEHAKCVYWGTTDDTSVWELMDGSTVIQSGTMHAVQEKQGL